MRSWARLAALAVAVGCSNSPSLGGPNDAGGERTVDGGSDAPSEAGDAASDEGPADGPQEEPSDWCDAQGIHLFCEDFDEGPLTQSWDGVVQEHGTARLDGTTYTSPFESFLATTTTLTEGAVAAVTVGKRVAFVATEMHLAFDLHPDALDATGVPAVAASIQTLDTLGEVTETLSLTLRATGASLDDDAPSDDGGPDFTASHPLTPALAAGAWVRIRIDAVFPDAADAGIGNGTVTVYVGDSSMPAIDHVPMAPTSQPGQPLFSLGIVSAMGPSQAFAVGFDNVTFDIQP